MKEIATEREELLLRSTSEFCQALLDPPPPPKLITKYFTPANPRITEHGPEWARTRLPFLAKTFSGESECEEYFTLLAQVLTMKLENDAFPAPESGEYVVDVAATAEKEEGELKGVVTVVGTGTFASIKTGKEWSEKFIYRFSGFDREGRIGHWEIWADPLSAWVAVGDTWASNLL